MECAVEADGIRVNTVHPGVIDTPIWTKLSGSGAATCRSSRTRSPKPGCRSAGSDKAQVIANGVLFLASEASGYMTGAEL